MGWTHTTATAPDAHPAIKSTVDVGSVVVSSVAMVFGTVKIERILESRVKIECFDIQSMRGRVESYEIDSHQNHCEPNDSSLTPNFAWDFTITQHHSFIDSLN